ncbi:MAG: hypothetical protein IK130_11890 [Oscillospiraceae bacterium]|nr:hypothetical protein [Oscillospiraceae bacterium]
MVSVAHIAAFCGVMRDILDAELTAGNVIAETRRSDMPYPGTVSVKLAYAFRTPVRHTLSGIVYRKVPDPNGKKAEYEDQDNHLLLICGTAE